MDALTPQNDLSSTLLAEAADCCKEELLRRMLTKRHCPPGRHPLSCAFAPRGTAARRRYRDSYLVGVGFGAKETKEGFAGTLAVRVYVRKKLPRGDLPRGCRIPPTVNGVPTDVIAVGRLRHHDRPVSFGASISRAGGGTGTLGCVVSIPGKRYAYLLSAAHVLAPDAQARAGDVIVEPAQADGHAEPIAILEDFEPLRGDGEPNEMDAAIARLDRKTDVRLTIPMIQTFRPEVIDATLYQSVRKFGATTGHTLGIVTDVSADVPLGPPGVDPLLYKGAIQITGCEWPFSDGGDSGALVVDALTSRPVGILFGGYGYRTFVTPMQRILTRFGATLAQ
jgi:hypothetical protein